MLSLRANHQYPVLVINLKIRLPLEPDQNHENVLERSDSKRNDEWGSVRFKIQFEDGGEFVNDSIKVGCYSLVLIPEAKLLTVEDIFALRPYPK